MEEKPKVMAKNKAWEATEMLEDDSWKEENPSPIFMSDESLIYLLEVLSKGYAKPDLSDDCCSSQRTVFETKRYFPYIMTILDELIKRGGMDSSKLKRQTRLA